MKNKKGLSGVITMLLLVALVLVLVGIIWGVVNSLVEGKISESEACSFIFGKLSIDSTKTCYEGTTLKFFIERKDLDIDALIVSIGGKKNSLNLELNSSVNDLVNDNLLNKKSGRGYSVDVGSIGIPESIKIAPIINGVSCEISDSFIGIEECS